MSFISLLVGPSAIHTANIDVVRQVTASGGTKGFHKPPEASTGIKYDPSFALLTFGVGIGE